MKYTNKNILILSCIALVAAVWFFTKRKTSAEQAYTEALQKANFAQNSKTTVVAEQNKLKAAVEFERIPYTAAVAQLKSGDVLMSNAKFTLQLYRDNSKTSKKIATLDYVPDEQFVIVNETGNWFKRNTNRWFAKEDLFNKAYIKRKKQ